MARSGGTSQVDEHEELQGKTNARLCGLDSSTSAGLICPLIFGRFDVSIACYLSCAELQSLRSDRIS